MIVALYIVRPTFRENYVGDGLVLDNLKAVPLHATKALERRGGIAPNHRPRH
jgi:hypothetical protein